jgi:hypothetical protein
MDREHWSAEDIGAHWGCFPLPGATEYIQAVRMVVQALAAQRAYKRPPVGPKHVDDYA